MNDDGTTQFICEGPMCKCSGNGEECDCDGKPNACSRCRAKMIEIDINTGEATGR